MNRYNDSSLKVDRDSSDKKEKSYNDVPRNDKIEYHFVKHLSEIISILHTFSEYQTEMNLENKNKDTHKHKPWELWFRGAIDAKHNLIPSLYRHPDVNGIGDLYEKQEKFLRVFQSREGHKIPNHQPSGLMVPSAESKLNWLCLMEHFQATTNFLNWSEGLLVGLYFSIEHLFNEHMKTPEKKFSCLWVLNPKKMNKFIWNDGRLIRPRLIDGYLEQKAIESIPTFHDIEKEIYGKKKFERVYPPRPINIFPLVTSDRILAQKGMFTLFPIELDGIKKIKNRRKNKIKEYYFRPLDCYDQSHEFLTCIILTNPGQIKKDLDVIGFNPHDVYPDITYRPGISYRR